MVISSILYTVMDYLTKWPEAIPIPNKKAPTVAQAYVTQIICRHGAPESILTDQGKEFVNEVLLFINQMLGTNVRRTSAYHPQTDGMVERFNATLLTGLTYLVEDNQKDWDEHIPFVLFAYRTTRHESTGETPFVLMHGRQAIYPHDVRARLASVESVIGENGGPTTKTEFRYFVYRKPTKSHMPINYVLKHRRRNTTINIVVRTPFVQKISWL